MVAEGKILLAGFDLEQEEKNLVNSIIKNYLNKIEQKIKFEEIKLRMKKSQHGKTFLHEIKGNLRIVGTKKEFIEHLLKRAEHYTAYRRVEDMLSQSGQILDYNKQSKDGGEVSDQAISDWNLSWQRVCSSVGAKYHPPEILTMGSHKLMRVVTGPYKTLTTEELKRYIRLKQK